MPSLSHRTGQTLPWEEGVREPIGVKIRLDAPRSRILVLAGKRIGHKEHIERKEEDGNVLIYVVLCVLCGYSLLDVTPGGKTPFALACADCELVGLTVNAYVRSENPSPALHRKRGGSRWRVHDVMPD